MHLEADGSALLGWEDGRESGAVLRTDTLVTPWLIQLRFDLPGRRRPVSLLICRDAVSPAEIRRLRTLLRFTVLNQ